MAEQSVTRQFQVTSTSSCSEPGKLLVHLAPYTPPPPEGAPGMMQGYQPPAALSLEWERSDNRAEVPQAGDLVDAVFTFTPPA